MSAHEIPWKYINHSIRSFNPRTKELPWGWLGDGGSSIFCKTRLQLRGKWDSSLLPMPAINLPTNRVLVDLERPTDWEARSENIGAMQRTLD